MLSKSVRKMFLLFFSFFPFFSKSYKPGVISALYKLGKISVFSTGSTKICANEDWHMTTAEFAIDPSYGKNSHLDSYDWCSTCNKSQDDQQFIGLHFQNTYIRIERYMIKNGCISNSCYCQETYCCSLYSWELQGSIDNSTWNTLHRVNGERLDPCEEKVYNLEGKKGLYSFFRLQHVGSMPGCWSCFTLNKLELYGDITDSDLVLKSPMDDLDDSEEINLTNGNENNTTIKRIRLKNDAEDEDSIIIGRKKIVTK